jgi:hypothetical protein
MIEEDVQVAVFTFCCPPTVSLANKTQKAGF